MIKYIRGENYNTATVQLEAMPNQVFAALVRYVEEQPDITMIKQDISNRMIEAEKDTLRVTAKVVDLGKGISELTIIVDAGDAEMNDEELALRVVKKICGDLDLDCQSTSK